MKRESTLMMNRARGGVARLLTCGVNGCRDRTNVLVQVGQSEHMVLCVKHEEHEPRPGDCIRDDAGAVLDLGADALEVRSDGTAYNRAYHKVTLLLPHDEWPRRAVIEAACGGAALGSQVSSTSDPRVRRVTIYTD